MKLPPDDRIAELPEFFDHNRNLEDRMRELCQQLATSPDDCDLDQIRQERDRAIERSPHEICSFFCSEKGNCCPLLRRFDFATDVPLRKTQSGAT